MYYQPIQRYRHQRSPAYRPITSDQRIVFRSPLHSLANNTTRQKLEPILNGVLLAATGLTKWTPIPILRRIVRAARLQNSQDLQRKIFIIKQLSLGKISPLKAQFTENRSTVSDETRELLNQLKIISLEIIKWTLIP